MTYYTSPEHVEDWVAYKAALRRRTWLASAVGVVLGVGLGLIVVAVT